MLASVVASRLLFLVKTHGDQEAFLDVSSAGLLSIGEIDVDAEDTGIIFWPKELDEESDLSPVV